MLVLCRDNERIDASVYFGKNDACSQITAGYAFVLVIAQPFVATQHDGKRTEERDIVFCQPLYSLVTAQPSHRQVNDGIRMYTFHQFLASGSRGNRIDIETCIRQSGDQTVDITPVAFQR